MASGKTLDMIAFTRSLRYYPQPPLDPRPSRDRSLAGKARIRARRAARRA